MTIRDYLASIIRTLVPVMLAAILTKLGITDVTIEGVPLDVVLSVVIVGLFYAGARKLEQRWPVVGLLLGWKAVPLYVPPFTHPVTGRQHYLVGPDDLE